MSALSNTDIERELIKGNILIYPFNRENIKGASYNFTVGQFAYKIPDTPGGEHEKCYDSIAKEITIPSKSTVIVATDESIWVSPQIAGTYHSKVSLVSKGLGHIGTTLDPTFLGTSFIALHNLSSQPIKLKRAHTFVSVTFYYLRSKATSRYQEVHDNTPARRGMFENMARNDEGDLEWLREDFRKEKEPLERKLKESETYIKLRSSYSRWSQNLRLLLPYLIIIFLIGVGSYLSTSSLSQRFTFFTDKAVPALLGALFAIVVADIRRKS
ncbi:MULTISPECIES: deoxycytidine triphosphate deaminase [Cyanophyceae]|uniref:dCTP deaminase domain-containing protein n=1 Tax=Cyanophyceae TaxID=3028117 RepID=UPI0016856401|nr:MULTISPECIES: deoxycytidine triphosphate deaminase [Cyanophyceae]MBD1918475.1 deoxycytidine triphosphate deaminase [Phormidium sp. FACHB-77]MBD2031364.1 deoxycytidine triphosphate deaminase [Phormidium sp. FACHB-322]MBD2049484.1 deoxycytidine triphosphate deaminase [Leptolyngbya sp. FACHB-60]